jgi:hypothetical protein
MFFPIFMVPTAHMGNGNLRWQFGCLDYCDAGRVVALGTFLKKAFLCSVAYGIKMLSSRIAWSIISGEAMGWRRSFPTGYGLTTTTVIYNSSILARHFAGRSLSIPGSEKHWGMPALILGRQATEVNVMCVVQNCG